MRSQYRARDIVAAGAWTWVAADGSIYVLIDAQSAIMDLVQARAELWRVTDSSVTPVGRSDVMSSAAEFGAYTFEDLTGDGVPDFFGYVADSAGVSYPVFLPGARGGLIEELAPAAPGWRFATEDPDTPQIVRGPGGACALQLRATDAPPDGQPEGWRYLALFRSGTLGPPRAVAPDCGLAGPSSGVQPDSPRP